MKEFWGQIFILDNGMMEDRVEEGNGGIVERWSNGVME